MVRSGGHKHAVWLRHGVESTRQSAVGSGYGGKSGVEVWVDLYELCIQLVQLSFIIHHS